MPTTRAHIYRGAPRLWIFEIPGVARGGRTTWRQAYDDADLIARLATRTPWPRNLPHRTPGAALDELTHLPATMLRPVTFSYGSDEDDPDDWPDYERRTPPDTCTDCDNIGHTEPWPAAPTTTPTTAAREPAGPASSPATAPTATPPSAESGTAPSPPGHPAPAGTSATTTTPATSEDPNTPDPATDGKAQSEATGPELDDLFAPYGYHLPRE